MTSTPEPPHGLGPRVIEVDAPPPAAPAREPAPAPRVTETKIDGPIARPEAAAKPPAEPTLPHRRHRRGAKLAVFGIGLLLLGWLGIDAANWILAAYERSLATGIIASVAIAAGVLGGLYFIVSELRSFFRLRSVETIQLRLAPVGTTLAPDEARREIGHVLTALPRDVASRATVQSYERQVQPHHTAAQQIEILSQSVIRPLDAQAEGAVRAAVLQAFTITAISPTAITDSIFFLGCGLRMVRGIAGAYGHRPGVAATVHLLRRLLLETGKLGAVDLVTGALMQHLGTGLLEKVAADLAEAVYAAQRMARLGTIIMGVCRPVPFQKGEAPSISSLIQHVITRSRG
jgi:putative membrane protein